MNKVCSKCKVEKSIDEFHARNHKLSSGTNAYCKNCAGVLARAHYHKNKQATKNRNKNTAIYCSDFVNNIKSINGCCICPENDVSCLDFHHLSSDDKESDVSRLTHSRLKIKLIAEIKKCSVLCSNCHRKFHAGKISEDKLVVVSLSKVDVDGFLKRKPRK